MCVCFLHCTRRSPEASFRTDSGSPAMPASVFEITNTESEDSFFDVGSLLFRRTNGFCTNSSPEGRADPSVSVLFVLCRVGTPVPSGRDFFEESSGYGRDHIEVRVSISVILLIHPRCSPPATEPNRGTHSSDGQSCARATPGVYSSWGLRTTPTLD